MDETPNHQPPPQNQGTQKNEPSQLAWATLILGVISWVALPFMGAVGALICGFIERGKIARGESPDAGGTVVLVGMLLGGVQLALTLLAVVAMVFLFLVFGVSILAL